MSIQSVRTISNGKDEADVVLASSGELMGKEGNITTAEVVAGIARLGLRQCPEWVSDQIEREQMRLRAEGRGDKLAMLLEPNGQSKVRIFWTRRQNLGFDSAGLFTLDDPSYEWDADYLWVLERPRYQD